MSTPAAEMGAVPPGPPETIPVVKFYGQNPGPLQATAAQMVAQNLQAAPMPPPQSGFPPSPAYGAPAPTTRSASLGEAVAPPQMVEPTLEPAGLPAAFVRRGPGSANARRAWKVVVQGQHGQSRVRAISPGCIRVGDPQPAEWVSEFGMGSIRVGSVLHRIIPDHFLDQADPYPGL